MMAGGVRPSVKMAKAALDDEVGSDSLTMTSGVGCTSMTIGDDDGGGGVGWGGNNIGECCGSKNTSYLNN